MVFLTLSTVRIGFFSFQFCEFQLGTFFLIDSIRCHRSSIIHTVAIPRDTRVMANHGSRGFGVGYAT